MQTYIAVSEDKKTLAKTIANILNLDIRLDRFFLSPDVFLLEADKSITIAQVRSLQVSLNRHPLSLPFNIGLILSAHRLTLPAQQACLKLLEEPGKHNRIFLATVNPFSLLPTIRSRAAMIHDPQPASVPPSNSPIGTDLLKDLLQAKTAERLKLLEPLAKQRQTALEFSRFLLTAISSKNQFAGLKITDVSRQLLLKQTLILHGQLKANLNVQLCLDMWALSFLDRG